MASASTRARVAVAPKKKAVEASVTAAPDAAVDYEDPKVQFEILNPETMSFNLVFEREVLVERIFDGKRVREAAVEKTERTIVIPRELTLLDLTKRRVMDDVEAFRDLYYLELRRVSPNEAISDPTFYSRNMKYLDVAMKLGAVRANLRELVASMSTYEDGSHPTASDISDGMPSQSLSELGFFILFELGKQPRKKATAGA